MYITLIWAFHFFSNVLFLAANGVLFHSASRDSNSVTRRFMSRDALILCAYLRKHGMIDRWWQWKVKKKHSVGNFTSVQPDSKRQSLIKLKVQKCFIINCDITKQSCKNSFLSGKLGTLEGKVSVRWKYRLQ